MALSNTIVLYRVLRCSSYAVSCMGWATYQDVRLPKQLSYVEWQQGKNSRYKTKKHFKGVAKKQAEGDQCRYRILGTDDCKSFWKKVIYKG